MSAEEKLEAMLKRLPPHLRSRFESYGEAGVKSAMLIGAYSAISKEALLSLALSLLFSKIEDSRLVANASKIDEFMKLNDEIVSWFSSHSDDSKESVH